MKLSFPTYLATSVLTLCIVGHAQSPASAPSGSTGQCNDGTYSQSASKKGACRGHQGVKSWFAADTASPAPAMSKEAQPSKAPSAPAASASMPSGSTGQCNDGSYSQSATKKGACRGHQGVKSWFAAEPAAAAAPSAPAMAHPAPAAQAPASPAPAQQPSAPAPPAKTKNSTASMQQAPGGGNGQVWVNTSTKVYHCPGERYYGKTKEGAYMSESDAKAKGARPDAGKPCKM